MDEPGSKSTVKTAETTFRILEKLNQRSEATVTELTEEFDLSVSSIHNYLKTLERHGYVIKEDGNYRIGLRFLDLGGRARQNHRLYQIGKDEVTTLAEETGEMANLLVEEAGRGIYLHRAHGEHAVQTDSYIGQRVHLHNTALGHAILAHVPRQRVDEIIETHGLPATTDQTITDRASLLDELDKVREQNVAYDDEARLKGLRCVAVPIRNNDGVIQGAISVSGPTSRFEGDRFRTELPEKLKSAANVIELNITYT
jgi:DNA-binding IclR family transcriptional regulator